MQVVLYLIYIYIWKWTKALSNNSSGTNSSLPPPPPQQVLTQQNKDTVANRNPKLQNVNCWLFTGRKEEDADGTGNTENEGSGWSVWQWITGMEATIGA